MYNQEFTPNIIRPRKSGRMSCVGHVARAVEKRNACKVFVGKRDLEYIDVDGRIILKYTLRVLGGRGLY
jgi:hypothetical protein